MKSYIVGGWVRDRLLEREGRTVSRGGDRDWVVVGATVAEMLAQGYTPVGRDFPVFLHPQTHEEYALARTERKSAPGYRGFVVHAAPEVTLEEDLQRRDLTINALALDDQERLIDPCGGLDDLRKRVLRHVGPAFVEDPVRILRLARFAARFPEFSIAPQTLELARCMVAAGEAAALVPERVWQELVRGLQEERPSRMLEVLADTTLLAQVAPELHASPALGAALDRAAHEGAPLAVRVAVLASNAQSGAGLRALLERLRADNESAQLARLLYDVRAELRVATTVAELLGVLERADAMRRPQRFVHLLQAAALIDPIPLERLRKAAAAASAVDAGAIAAQAGPDPTAIAQAITSARRAAIARALESTPGAT